MTHTKLNIALALSFGLFMIGQAYSSQPCGNCQGLTSKESKAMKQIYSYPEAVYGTNNRVGDATNGVSLSEGTNFADASKGVPLAEKSSMQMTGAAANLPIWNYNSINDLDRSLDLPAPVIDIQTPTSQQVLRQGFRAIEHQGITGAASPLRSYFPDVHDNFWASEQINRLARENIAQGYPNGLFKPNSSISRAEMASLLVRGMELDGSIYSSGVSHFKDVPSSYWAYNLINAAKENGLMSGYSDNTFKPEAPISKIEAMTMLSKKIDNNMSQSEAKDVLSKYNGGKNVPNWAQKDVAKVIEADGLKDLPNSDNVFTNSNISRAEVASMLDNIRISLGYDEKDVPISKADVEKSYVPVEEMVTVPTLKLVFKDIVSARSATVGDIFAAKTIDKITVDGVDFPAGSTVRGKVSEVIRPSKGNDGALKLSFETIEGNGYKAQLPTQILAAQVNHITQPNFGVRLIQMPMTLVGGIIGTAGRTVGGAAISLSNAVEQTFNGIGVATGELASANFKASGRSMQDVGKAIVMAPVDLTRNAVVGSFGVLKSAGDEVAYLVDIDGHNVSTIKPKEEVTISFGCYK